MWKRISLRVRIYLMLFCLVFIPFAGGMAMVWYTYRIEVLFSYIVDRNMAAFQVAEELETALINQKGFVSYYFLDGDPDWLKQLGQYRQIFSERIRSADVLIEAESQQEILNNIRSEYSKYIILKDQVIELYKAGDRDRGRELHKVVRDHFFNTLKFCEQFKAIYTNRVQLLRDESVSHAKKLRFIAGIAILIALFLAIIMAYFLIKHILEPVRRLAIEADRDFMALKSPNEVKSLKKSVQDLIEDRDHTHTELERSRETLLQAEKMAMVGKLAAGVAHSIRNPLTSVKMRLFSLNRTLEISQTQKEDFQVISEEISHIDTIVQNFLEFSRPPKLKMQQMSPSEVVDQVLQLLRHRLESCDVNVKLHRSTSLPKAEIDPEQMKEAIVNLIVNACDAMGNSGLIEIIEKDGFEQSFGKIAQIQVSDNGPGISETIRDKVFQPFFTTKEEGTGLGLSITERIIKNHGGRLEMESVEH